MTEIPNSRTGSLPAWIRKLLGMEKAATPAKPAAHPAIEADALDRLKVEDVMVPRADIIAVELGTPLGELAAVFAEASHSRLPVSGLKTYQMLHGQNFGLALGTRTSSSSSTT